jgi:PHP family Zn ribbon phosphoesterase
MNKGIIYLIQPCELLGTSRYKIGCSTNLELERIKNGYKKGTRYIIIMECYDPFFLEKNIKRVFNEKFKLIAGNEYFEGDEKNIKDEFLKIVIEYEKENKVDEKENIDILFCNLDDQIIISK